MTLPCVLVRLTTSYSPAVNSACMADICRYRVDGSGGWETGYRWDSSRVLVDPYARHVAGRRQWATRDDFEDFQTTVHDHGVERQTPWAGLQQSAHEPPYISHLPRSCPAVYSPLMPP